MTETECVNHFWTRWDASSELACMWCHKTHTRHIMDENMILRGLIREVMAADWRTNDNTLWPRLVAATSEQGAND